MFEHIKNTKLVKLVCDKCGRFDTARESNYNETFYGLGWSLNSKAKKYKHRCYGCLTGEERKAKDFVRAKFG